MTPRTIFITLPVADIARSTAFYLAIGLRRNDAFSNERATSLTWSDAITIMVADHALFATLTPKRIIDAHSSIGPLIALSFGSRAEVDAITQAAVAAGGREPHGPEDHGFMYARAFEDPDGHGFGPMCMEPGTSDSQGAQR